MYCQLSKVLQGLSNTLPKQWKLSHVKIEGQAVDLLYRQELFMKSSQDSKDFKVRVIIIALLLPARVSIRC